MSLGIGVGIACTALAARQGDSAAAAFALSQHVVALLMIFNRIVGAGIAAVVGQCLGAGRHDAAERVARAALGAASWIGLSCALVAAAFAGPLLRLMNAPPEVLPLAVPFLQVLAPGMLLDVWAASMNAVLRAHLRSREALVVVLLMHGLHLVGALVLMPRLGLMGFALSLVASRLVGLLLLARLWRQLLGIRPRLSDLWRLPRAELAALLHIGAPGAAENIAYRLCFTLSVAVVGTFGGAALATHAYTTQITYAALMFGLTMGFSMEILVAHRVGAARLHEADRLVRRTLGWSLVVSVAGTVAVALAAPTLLARFSTDPAVVALGTSLLWWTVLLEPGRTFNLVLVNALRATGDARYPVQVGAGSMLLVLAGGSWLLGSVLGLGLVGVWIAYAADEWLRGLLMWRRWRGRGWLPHARRARRRVAR